MARETRRRTIGTAVVAALIGTGLAVSAPLPAYAEDPVAGALTAGDSLFPHQGNGGYDALHYDIDLTVDVAVSGTNNAAATTTFPEATASIRATTTGAPLSSYAFDFQGSTGDLAASTLNVDSVTVNGEPATFSRIETTTPSNTTTDVHKLIVTPATPVSGEFVTVVRYSGRPVTHTDADGSIEGWINTTDGATFVNQPVGAMTAFPNNNTPSDKATYTFTVDAPSKLTTSNQAVSANPGLKDAAVAGNGTLVSRTPSADGDRTTWVWDQPKPMASMLAMLSVGRYDVFESDIALASGTTLKEWTFLDPAQSASQRQTTLATRAQVPAILDYLESQYGPYPGVSTGLVVDIAPSALNYALETQDRSFFPGSASRSTTIHELTHQWFGDSVSPADWNDIWISEGTATYAENLTAYSSSGTTTSSNETIYYNSWNSSSPTSALWTTPTAAMTQASQLFGSQVYSRGSWTLEALRTAIGAADFAELMTQWQERYHGTSRRTTDFVALAEEVSDRELTAFLQPWLYGTTKAPWPSRFELGLTGPTAPLAAGDATSYTLTARNNGKVALTGATVEVDLADVLGDAVLGTLPVEVALTDDTLTWTVPTTAVGTTASVVLPLTVDADATGETLAAVAAPSASTLGATCVGCTSSVVVGATPVSPAPTPTITGTPTVGTSLTADPGTWAAGATLAYQWLVDGAPVPGATGPTFTPSVAHVGLPVRVTVTGTAGGSSPTTMLSAATANVVRGNQAAADPTITGTPQFGKALTVSTGTGWLPGTYFTYQWAVNGANVTGTNGGTGPTFTPSVATQAGGTVTVTVTGTKAGYSNLIKTSTATGPIAAGVFDLSPTPTVTGAPRALAPLVAAPGQWDDGTTLTYQWAVGGADVPSATARTFTPTLAQIGQTATVTVTATKPGYPTTSRTSPATAAIAPAAQVLTPTPTVAGFGKVDEPLTATPGTWDADTTLALQWSVDGEPVAGATGDTYTPVPADVGSEVTVTVTSTKTDYATTERTSLPVTVVDGDLTLTPTPTISGTPQVGQTLTALPGTWDDDVELSYAWAVGGTPLLTVTGSTYVPTGEDLGKPVTVAVTGTKTGYATVSRTSDETAAVAVGALTLTPKPAISGTPAVGSLLTAVPGTWDAGVALTYRWKVAGAVVVGATGASYAPVPADVGKTVTVEVTGTRLGYTTVTKASDVTTTVVLGTQAATPVPAISGVVKVGVPLTVDSGAWDAGVALTYQWSVGGHAVVGATGPSYTPTVGDLGATVRVTVTGTRPGFVPVTRESPATSAVLPGDLTAAPVPQIAGTSAAVGVALTAVPGTWDDGVTMTYQWSAGGTPIAGATAPTYTPSAADVGKPITVAVTGTKSGYAATARTSPQTAPVALGSFAKTLSATIKGKARAGAILRAKAGTWPAAASVAFAWKVRGKVAGTAAAWKVPKSAVGRKVTLTVTVSAPGFATQKVTVKSGKVKPKR